MFNRLSTSQRAPQVDPSTASSSAVGSNSYSQPRGGLVLGLLGSIVINFACWIEVGDAAVRVMVSDNKIGGV